MICAEIPYRSYQIFFIKVNTNNWLLDVCTLCFESGCIWSIAWCSNFSVKLQCAILDSAKFPVLTWEKWFFLVALLCDSRHSYTGRFSWTKKNLFNTSFQKKNWGNELFIQVDIFLIFVSLCFSLVALSIAKPKNPDGWQSA